MNYWIIPGIKSNPDDLGSQNICHRISILINIHNLNKNTRKREFVWARYSLIYTLKKQTDLSLAKIGDYFGFDHSNVIHALKSVKEALQTKKSYEKELEIFQYYQNKIIK